MKKKLTVNTLALSNLKTRRKQYFIMLTGIICAMVFSSTILFFASSMVTSMKEMSKNSIGNCNSILMNADGDFVKKAYDDKYITEYGLAHIIGFAQTEECEKGQGAAIAYLDDRAKELSYISFIEGSYPQNEGEIALEKSALSRLRLSDASIGDTITLDFYNQNGEQTEDEPVKKTFTLVGIAKNKLSNIMDSYVDSQKYLKAIPSAFVYQGADTDLGGRENLCCYLNYNRDLEYEGEKDAYMAFYSYLEDNGVDSDNWMTIYEDNYLFYNSETSSSIMFAILLAAVMLVASCMGVINSFGANLKERKKQIGLFRTVGATKRQIVLIYGREAFLISLVCTPASVLISYFIVKGSTGLFGEDFVFIPNIWVLVLSGIAGVFFVMLAALIPLISASRISPIQSIRNIAMTRKMKTKKIKSQKSFNTPSLLAKRSLVFHSGKRVIVSIFLVGTIIFSCYGFSYMDYAKGEQYIRSYDYQIFSDGQVIYSPFINIEEGKKGYNENNKRGILLSPYVKEVNGSKSCSVLIMTDEFSDYQKAVTFYNGWGVFSDNFFKEDGTQFTGEITKDNIDELFFSDFCEDYLLVKDKNSIKSNFLSGSLNSVNYSVFDKLKNSVADGSIDINKLNSGEEVILYAPQKVGINVKNEDSGYSTDIDMNNDFKADKEYMKSGVCDYKAGDKIDISILTGDKITGENSYPDNCEKSDFQVTVGAIIHELPDGFYDEYQSFDTIMLLTTNEGMNTFSPDEKYNLFNINLKEECTDEIDEQMQSLLQELSDATGTGYIYSSYGNAKEQEQLVKTMFISMLAIIILFLSISASIINNSLTSQIREGKREMGTLRAVGASQSEIVMSYIKQLISIFGWGYGLGFAGFGITYGIANLVAYSNAKTFGYEFTGLELNVNLWQTALACVILFAVCSINLWLKIRKEMKNSIIDNIREL